MKAISLCLFAYKKSSRLCVVVAILDHWNWNDEIWGMCDGLWRWPFSAIFKLICRFQNKLMIIWKLKNLHKFRSWSDLFAIRVESHKKEMNLSCIDYYERATVLRCLLSVSDCKMGCSSEPSVNVSETRFHFPTCNLKIKWISILHLKMSVAHVCVMWSAGLWRNKVPRWASRWWRSDTRASWTWCNGQFLWCWSFERCEGNDGSIFDRKSGQRQNSLQGN